jgi:hypothetical protein
VKSRLLSFENWPFLASSLFGGSKSWGLRDELNPSATKDTAREVLKKIKGNKVMWNRTWRLMKNGISLMTLNPSHTVKAARLWGPKTSI